MNVFTPILFNQDRILERHVQFQNDINLLVLQSWYTSTPSSALVPNKVGVTEHDERVALLASAPMHVICAL